MYIALACLDLDIAPSFNSCTSFMCYKVERGKIVSCQNLANLFLSPKDQAAIMHELDIKVVIVNSIDEESKNALNNAGIEVVVGAVGSAHNAAKNYVSCLLHSTNNPIVVP